MVISQTTRSALASYKANGGIIGVARSGNWRPATEARRAAARAADASVGPMIRELRGEGLSLQAIANILTAEGLTTRRGATWTKCQVSRVLQRAGI